MVTKKRRASCGKTIGVRTGKKRDLRPFNKSKERNSVLGRQRKTAEEGRRNPQSLGKREGMLHRSGKREGSFELLRGKEPKEPPKTMGSRGKS